MPVEEWVPAEEEEEEAPAETKRPATLSARHAASPRACGAVGGGSVRAARYHNPGKGRKGKGKRWTTLAPATP